MSDATGLVFRSPRGKPLSDMTLSNLIKGLGIAAVPHATLDDAGTAETLLIQWQWWRRRESIRPEVHISSYFRKTETPDPRETLKSRGPGTKQVQ